MFDLFPIILLLVILGEKIEKYKLLKQIDLLTSKVMAKDYTQYANVELAKNELGQAVAQMQSEPELMERM